MKTDNIYLKPTSIINSDHLQIIEFTSRVLSGETDPTKKAVKLFYAVRDGIWYDPYVPFHRPEHYRASNVLKLGRGYCVYKASLLCAMGRACGIPSRVGFADVRNHLITQQLLEHMGTDIFVYHGWVEFYLNEKWVKATPAFNKELCEKHNVPPLEFNGNEDALFQPYNLENKKFMEYVKFHGTYADIPVDEIVSAWESAYGKEKVRGWMREFDKKGYISNRNFLKEKVIK